MKLLVAGGRMRPAGAFDRDHEPLYREARLVLLDTVTGHTELLLSWVSEGPWDPRAVGHCFKGARRDDDGLLLCTEREVIATDREGRIREVRSHPWFNDLHDAMRHEGRLWVCSTGLDAVLEFRDGEIERVHGFGSRRLEDRDYRALSTKPHEVHPNHLFVWDGAVWVTRFHSADAVALDAPTRRLPIEGPPHDGLPVGDRVWFTTVDGRLVAIDPRSDAREIHRLSGQPPLGWCRGLYVDGDVAWVGMSRLRATRARRHLARLRGWLRGGRFDSRWPTRVIAHQLSTGAELGAWEMESAGLHAIFAVVPWIV